MFKQGSTRISLVMVVALALLLLLITSTTSQTQVALAKADEGSAVQQVNARQMQPMTGTMSMGPMGMGRTMQMMGMMLQMMGEMQNMMPAATGMMTGTMPMTGAMGMGHAGMTPMLGMMGQMHNLMMQHLQTILASCPGAMSATTAMTMPHAMTNTMRMTGATAMGSAGMDQPMSQMMQMMQSHMQQMMGGGMGMMSNTMPMTGTVQQPSQMGMRGRDLQMMGMMLQMMGQMENMMGMETGVMTSTMPMKSTMPMTSTTLLHTDLCQMMGMMNQMLQMMGSQMHPFDLLFIDSMVMHHQGAIEMAKEAQQKAEHPELKQMADDIITSQAAEIKQMQTWRNAWYPNAPETDGMGMSMGTMKIADDASKPFDLRFIEAMIPHHEGAIAMAKEALAKAQHQEIKTLAGNIIAAQQKEIAQMQAWKAAWFK